MTYFQYIGKAQGKECYYDSFRRRPITIEENRVRYVEFTQEVKDLVDFRLKTDSENIVGFISNQTKRVEKMYSIEENLKNGIS